MNSEEMRRIKSRIQRLETLISQFDEDVSVLTDSGIDVSNETTVAERQNEIQDEMEQVISDLLVLLDTSDAIEQEDIRIQLPDTGRRPVSDGNLPEPAVDRPEGRGPPSWAGGGGNGR